MKLEDVGGLPLPSEAVERWDSMWDTYWDDSELNSLYFSALDYVYRIRKPYWQSMGASSLIALSLAKQDFFYLIARCLDWDAKD